MVIKDLKDVRRQHDDDGKEKQVNFCKEIVLRNRSLDWYTESESKEMNYIVREIL